MGRVFFPTYRANIIGVRDVGPYSQLGGMDGLDGSIVIPRAPAEPYPRPANNPTQRMLGAAMLMADGGGTSEMIRVPYPIDFWGGPMPKPPVRSFPVETSPIVAAPGAPVVAPAPAPPVSAQGSPTPVVTMPPSPQPGAILVSSGGGTAAPSTAPITIQTGDTMSAVTAWLQGSTPIFSYTVPNVVLAGGVILLFAWLSSGSGKKR